MAEFELSVSVIPVDKSKDEKTFTLSSSLAKQVVDNKKDKQISGNHEVKGLCEDTQKLDVVAAVIFILIDVKGESESKQKKNSIFAMITF